MKKEGPRGVVARSAAGLIAFGILFSTPPTEQPFSTFPVGGSNDNRCWTYTTPERGFARRMNADRVSRDLRRLSLDPELSKSARVHTREMTDSNLLHHTTETALRRRVTDWSTLGENVGVGATVDSLHAAFMASPAHRHNILYSTFRHVGVGVIKGGGRMWVTVLFSSGADPGTTLRMPRC